ncbi:MAG: hypothetical protein JXR13_10160 [Thalassovita sp.]
MTLLRTYLALGLALILVMTAQTMAVARGAPAAVGQMELCSGSSAIVVLVDANGVPVEPAHLCPDCALSFFDSLDVPAAELIVPTSASMLRWDRTTVGQDPLSLLDTSARSPPVLG